MEHEELTGTIIGCAMRVHDALGTDYLESVYQRALALELGLHELPVERERRVQVRYHGVVVGDFIPDLLVADRVIVEVKAVGKLVPRHEAQLVNYLAATGIEIGLLLNFGAPRLEFRRKARTYRPRSTGG